MAARGSSDGDAPGQDHGLEFAEDDDEYIHRSAHPDLADRLGAPLVRSNFISSTSYSVRAFAEEASKLMGSLEDEISDAKCESLALDDCDISVDDLGGPADSGAAPPTTSGARESGGGDEAGNAGTRTLALPAEASNGNGNASGTALAPTISDDEVILKVAVFHPDNPRMCTQVILVLASQPLSALKDAISCMRDDISQKYELDIPSSFFYIDGVFYDDMRRAGAVRYSSPIMDFIAQKQLQGDMAGEFRRKRRRTARERARDRQARSRNLAPAPTPPQQDIGFSDHFSVTDMEDTTFADLEIRLGPACPYVYCHQGCCEHKICFMDMRRAHASDSKLRSCYPEVVHTYHPKHVKCMVCKKQDARYVTYNDERAMASPCLFCDVCYKSLHYSQDGQLLYKGFEVYEYPDYIPRKWSNEGRRRKKSAGFSSQGSGAGISSQGSGAATSSV